MPEVQYDFAGRRAGLSVVGNIVGNGLDLTAVAVGATITIGAESTDVRNITIQLTDANGANLAERASFILGVYSSAAGTTFASTGGSTGVAGAVANTTLTLSAKKLFYCTTTATGGWTGTWTDTATETFALGVQLPSGRTVMSTAQANA